MAMTVRRAPFGDTPERAQARPVPAVPPQRASTTREAPDPLGCGSVAAAEAEREALAREMHDEVLQSLVAARYAIDLAERRPESASFDGVRSALSAAITAARHTMWDLRSRPALEGGLAPALLALATRQPGDRPVRLSGALLPGVDQFAEVAAYRVVQAVLRQARQAGGGGADVVLGTAPSSAVVTLTLDVALPLPGPDADDLDRWSALLRSVGGDVHVRRGAGTSSFALHLPRSDGGAA